MRPGTRLVPSASRRTPEQRAPSHLALGIALSALCVVLVLAGVPLPDPSWIPGLYDDGDYDALLAAFGDLTPPDLPPGIVHASPIVVESLMLPLQLTIGFDVSFTVRLRAPPFA